MKNVSGFNSAGIDSELGNRPIHDVLFAVLLGVLLPVLLERTDATLNTSVSDPGLPLFHKNHSLVGPGVRIF